MPITNHIDDETFEDCFYEENLVDTTGLEAEVHNWGFSVSGTALAVCTFLSKVDTHRPQFCDAAIESFRLTVTNGDVVTAIWSFC